jgi:hypothetical protein
MRLVYRIRPWHEFFVSRPHIPGYRMYWQLTPKPSGSVSGLGTQAFHARLKAASRLLRTPTVVRRQPVSHLPGAVPGIAMGGLMPFSSGGIPSMALVFCPTMTRQAPCRFSATRVIIP